MKKLIAVGVVIALILSLTACTFPKYLFAYQRSDTTADEIGLIKDESFFSDFEIDGNTVNFTCELTFKNNSEKEISCYLVGDFEPEYKVGLIKERYLRGINYEDKREKLSFKPKERKTVIYVFKGNHGKGNQKPNRLLPEIKIYKVKK